LRKVHQAGGKNYGGKNNGQDMDDLIPADLVPLYNNHAIASSRLAIIPVLLLWRRAGITSPRFFNPGV
jgi:hypothetical protein